MAVANYLESTGDLIETNMVTEGLQRIALNLHFSPGTLEVIQPLYEAVADALRDALTSLANDDRELALKVVARKGEIEKLATAAMQHLGTRLLADEPRRIEAFSLETDIMLCLYLPLYGHCALICLNPPTGLTFYQILMWRTRCGYALAARQWPRFLC